jgi:hypothetical protein
MIIFAYTIYQKKMVEKFKISLQPDVKEKARKESIKMFGNKKLSTFIAFLIKEFKSK